MKLGLNDEVVYEDYKRGEIYDIVHNYSTVHVHVVSIEFDHRRILHKMSDANW